MAKKTKVGITLSDETLAHLELMAKNLGLSKSGAIAMAINTYFVNSNLKNK